MRITALAGWFGGKRTLAAQIVAEFGAHKAYWEPFCGSMAILFNKPICRLETVNDLHRDVTHLARVVRDKTLGRELYERARLMCCSDEELATADTMIRGVDCNGELSVDRALAFLIVCWMGRSGECGLSPTDRGRSLCIRWGNTGGAPGTRWSAAVRSIGAWRRRLEGVTVTNRNGLDMLDSIKDEVDAVIYLDPPYLRKSDKYLHDFTSEDHLRMAESVKKFKRARVVISYYDEPELDELYDGWTKRRLSAMKNLSNQGNGVRKATTRAPEVLLINGPSYAADSATLF